MNNNVTIINNRDGTVDVMVDGDNEEKIPTSNLDSNIHAVQWYKDHGEIEYMDHNEEFDDFSTFLSIINDRDTEMDRRVQEKLADEPSPAEQDRDLRDNLLRDTDWIVTKYSEIGEPVPEEWATYRQALRDISLQDGFPGNVEWPTEPTTSV